MVNNQYFKGYSKVGEGLGNPIMDITIMSRELTPFEHLVANHLCDGLSNAAIARAGTTFGSAIESIAAISFGVRMPGGV